MAESVIVRRGGGSSVQLVSETEYTNIFDYTVTSATTSITFDGFELEEDEEYMLYCDIYGLQDVGIGYLLFFNNNTTLTNYYVQLNSADSTTVSGTRRNDSRFIAISGNGTNIRSNSMCKIKLTNNGYATFQSNTERHYGTSGVFMENYYGTSTFTMPSITSLTINSPSTNGIGAGSRFQLRKISNGDTSWATI